MKDPIKHVLAAFEHDPRINLHKSEIHLSFADGIMTLEGEAEDIAAKKTALRLAAAAPGVVGIVDRLHVRPGEELGDGAIRDRLTATLVREPALMGCPIEVEVDGGVIILNGEVASLAHKRLAGVLAWWAPGCRDVVNGLEVNPPMADNDGELADAVALVLERDPFIKADQIRVTARNGTVMLHGTVANDVLKQQAEMDAWYVFGVDEVDNRLEVLK